MALEPAPDPLSRALAVARAEEPPESWTAITDAVRRRVRALGTGPAEPLVVRGADGRLDHDEHGSRTVLSSRALLAVLRRRLLTAPTHAPEGIRLRVQDGELVGIDLSLVGAYGLDLVALADTVRRDVVATVVALLGPGGPLGAGQVHVELVDVVVGDPRVT